MGAGDGLQPVDVKSAIEADGIQVLDTGDGIIMISSPVGATMWPTFSFEI